MRGGTIMKKTRCDELVEKIMNEVDPRDKYAEDDPDIKKIDVRKGAPTGEPKSYEDWVKSQPKSRAIGIHKKKVK